MTGRGQKVLDRGAIIEHEPEVGPCAPRCGCHCLEPSDAELRWVGLSETQIETLYTYCEEGDFTLEEINALRAAVYGEALRLLMERTSDEDSLRDDLGLIRSDD